jgi:hypothetical protein
MSSRISISYTSTVHIYECVNTFEIEKSDSDSGWALCMTDLQGSKESYNGDIIISRKNLRQIYDDLKKFFKDS